MQYAGIPWDARQGKVFVESNKDSALSNCSLTYHCNSWNKPIWIMGDSYINAYEPNRWTYYLPQKGDNNYLLNGFPGRNSETALVSLKNMLQYSTPKEIIWCMGMNDGDTDSGVNEEWKTVLFELESLCRSKNIELVLSTIPTCPEVNNDYKNDFIKEDGHRYIDFAKAVGSYENKEWYKGMLDSTEESPCHPTVEGALALYNEAVISCPELLDK